jgi:hypothetical protein
MNRRLFWRPGAEGTFTDFAASQQMLDLLIAAGKGSLTRILPKFRAPANGYAHVDRVLLPNRSAMLPVVMVVGLFRTLDCAFPSLAGLTGMSS